MKGTILGALLLCCVAAGMACCCGGCGCSGFNNCGGGDLAPEVPTKPCGHCKNVETRPNVHEDKFGGYVYSLHANKLPWDQAYKACKDEKAELAWFDNQQEFEFAQKFLERVAPGKGADNQVFLGGVDTIRSGGASSRIQWMHNGAFINQKDPMWGAGQPNLNQNEHCTAMFNADTYPTFMLNDFICSSPLKYMCKVKACN